MKRGIIVTGGGHGIGKQICLDCLSAGDKVCFIDIDEKTGKATYIKRVVLKWKK